MADVSQIPIVVTAADGGFAMQLATMAASIAANTTGSFRLFVLDGGIGEADKRRVRESCPSDQVELVFLHPDTQRVKGLKTNRHITESTYFRLEIGELLPLEIEKIIYLDADLIVLGDIRELWSCQLNSHHLLAVEDFSCPRMDAATLENFPANSAYLTCQHPVKLYKKFGIPGSAKYFNAGVLVLDLVKWRRDAIGETVLRYLRDHDEHVRFVDQDGLNVVLWDKWADLAPSWNQMPHIYRFPSWKHSPFDKATFNQVRRYPKIVHFLGGGKPWCKDQMHPYRPDYFWYLDKTAWAGWGTGLRREWPMRWPGLWDTLRRIKRTSELLKRPRGSRTP